MEPKTGHNILNLLYGYSYLQQLHWQQGQHEQIIKEINIRIEITDNTTNTAGFVA